MSSYKTQSIDTSIEAEKFQFNLWRKLTTIQKAAIVSNWTKGCWEMSLNAIRDRYPNATPKKIKQEFALLTLKTDELNLHLNLNFQRHLMLSDPISLALVVADILDSLEIPYLVGGSVASTLLGEPRSTQDIDMVIDLSPDKVTSLINLLQPRFYVSEAAVLEAIQYKRSFNIIDNESLGKVDFFILKNDPFPRTEFRRRQAKVVRQNPDRVLFLPTAEDIILQKLIWHNLGFGSQKQWRDILGVIKLQGETLDFNYLRQWGTNLGLLESLERALNQSGL